LMLKFVHIHALESHLYISSSLLARKETNETNGPLTRT
jgi:hypothetical protein